MGVLIVRDSLAVCMFYLTFSARPQGARSTAQAGLSVVWTPLWGERGWLAASADGVKRK